MLSEVTNEVEYELEAAKYVAITTDMWTSVAKNLSDILQT